MKNKIPVICICSVLAVAVLILCVFIIRSCTGADTPTADTDEAAYTTADSAAYTEAETIAESEASSEAVPETDKQAFLPVFDLEDFINKVKQVYSRKLPDGEYKLSNINDMAFLCTVSNANDEIGPIGLCEATLVLENNTTEVYLLFLGGTEFVSGQATDILTDIRAGLSKDNDYTRAIISVINENIPKNSKIIITGLSLGGMVAQQIATDVGICNNYDILYSICIGSPLVSPTQREGVVLRFEDTADIVPSLSTATYLYGDEFAHEVISGDGGYDSFIYAHTFSYVESDVWKKYDAVGTENGTAYIMVNTTQFRFFDAPSQSRT